MFSLHQQMLIPQLIAAAVTAVTPAAIGTVKPFVKLDPMSPSLLPLFIKTSFALLIEPVKPSFLI